jgi:hypothetical protein
MSVGFVGQAFLPARLLFVVPTSAGLLKVRESGLQAVFFSSFFDLSLAPGLVSCFPMAGCSY